MRAAFACSDAMKSDRMLMILLCTGHCPASTTDDKKRFRSDRAGVGRARITYTGARRFSCRCSRNAKPHLALEVCLSLTGPGGLGLHTHSDRLADHRS